MGQSILFFFERTFRLGVRGRYFLLPSTPHASTPRKEASVMLPNPH